MAWNGHGPPAKKVGDVSGSGRWRIGGRWPARQEPAEIQPQPRRLRCQVTIDRQSRHEQTRRHAVSDGAIAAGEDRRLYRRRPRTGVCKAMVVGAMRHCGILPIIKGALMGASKVRVRHEQGKSDEDVGHQPDHVACLIPPARGRSRRFSISRSRLPAVAPGHRRRSRRPRFPTRPRSEAYCQRANDGRARRFSPQAGSWHRRDGSAHR